MVSIRARGLNVALHLSRLADSGILLCSVEKLDARHVQLVCSRGDMSYVVQYLTDNNFCDIIVTKMGWYRVMDGMRRYMVLCVMLLLLVPILYLNSIYCTSVVVSGDIESDTVIDALAEIGVCVGMSLVGIDYDSIEDYLSSTLDLSYTLVEVVGNRLYVSTVDNTSQSQIIDYTQSHDILASYSGTITAISVVQGTAVVSVGQYVCAGDTLISGMRTYSDGSTIPIYAIGTVTAEVQVSSTVQYTGYIEQWQYTGNESTIVGISLGNTTVYSHGCSYSYYDVTTSTVSLYPLAIDITYYYMVEKVSTRVVVTFDEILADMQQQALQDAMQQAYFTVDNTIYTTQQDSSVTVTLLGSIVISSDTLASNGG